MTHMRVVRPPWLGMEEVVSGLFVGIKVIGSLLDEVTEVRTGQLVTSGGH